MNRAQKMVVGAGVVIIFVMGVFPPWARTFDMETPMYKGHTSMSAGYRFIGSPPAPRRAENPDQQPFYGVRVDVGRLSVQWMAVILVVAGLALLLHVWESKKEKETQSLLIQAFDVGEEGAGEAGPPAPTPAAASPPPEMISEE